MKKYLLGLLMIATAASAWGDETKIDPSLTPEQVVDQFRDDLLAKRADIMAKGLRLTADQAAKFWPLYEQFQTEQGAIVDGQLAATQKYAEHFKTLSDADALEYVNALLARDQ